MLHGEPKKRDFPALSAFMIVHAVVVVVVSIKIKTVNQTEMSMAEKNFPDQLRLLKLSRGLPVQGNTLTAQEYFIMS
jgi:hypothetical protein